MCKIDIEPCRFAEDHLQDAIDGIMENILDDDEEEEYE